MPLATWIVRRIVAGLMLAALLATVLSAYQTTAAQAADGDLCSYTDANGDLHYVVCGTVPGGGGGGGGGGAGDPTCDLSNAPYVDYCKGSVACLYHNPAVLGEDIVGDDAGPKPGEDYHLAYWGCADDSGEWFWTNDDGPTTEQSAWQAFGQLNFPDFAPVFNPPGRTLVNLDTWWWADGASADEIVGSSAAGIRALATPGHMEIDPGDGSATQTCEFSTVRSAACRTVYRRSSDRMPNRVYPAQMRLVWDVRFEDGGSPLNLPGLPSSFTSDWHEAPVPVREVQTIVRPND